MNNSGNGYRKSDKDSARSLYVTLLVILMSVAVVVAVAGSIAKNVKKADPKPNAVTTERSKDQTDDTKDAFSHKEDSETDGETLPKDTDADTTEPVTSAPEDTEDAAASASVLPTFSAPCDGEVLRSYSGSVPVFSVTMEDWRTHSGIDLYAPAGSDIKAVADGVIGEVWDDAMMGTCVSVEHSGGAVSIYKNLADELPAWIEKGVSVKSGDTIAAAGESALEEIADESHLHFELKINGAGVDPKDYIQFSSEHSYEG